MWKNIKFHLVQDEIFQLFSHSALHWNHHPMVSVKNHIYRLVLIKWLRHSQFLSQLTLPLLWWRFHVSHLGGNYNYCPIKVNDCFPLEFIVVWNFSLSIRAELYIEEQNITKISGTVILSIFINNLRGYKYFVIWCLYDPGKMRNSR